MTEPVCLSDAERQFVEHLGLHFEGMGLPRIGGRMLGLLLVSPRPLTLDEMVRLLEVSKASVSTNLRFFVQFRMVTARALPGDRRRFYAIGADAWESRLDVLHAQADGLARLAAEGLAVVASGNGVARAQLGVLQEFSTFLEGEARAVKARWRALKGRRDAG